MSELGFFTAKTPRRQGRQGGLDVGTRRFSDLLSEQISLQPPQNQFNQWFPSSFPAPEPAPGVNSGVSHGDRLTEPLKH
jgi:hypothetical protein